MHLILVFKDYELSLTTFQSFKLLGTGVVETATFGNTPVQHKDVLKILTGDGHVILDFEDYL